MQIARKDSKFIPSVYLTNPRLMTMVENCSDYSGRKYNLDCPQVLQKESSHVITPNMHYICTGDKFVPISTNMSSFESTSSSKITTNNINKEATENYSIPPASLNMKSPCWLVPSLIPLNNTKSQNGKNTSCDGPNFKISKNYNYERRTAMKNQAQPEMRKNIQNLYSQSKYFTGTIERILRWNRNLLDIFCLYETIAPVISLQEGNVSHQKVMLLRDRKGPILQVQFYASTHIDITDFHIGQYLRCVGRMIGMNILSAENIREAKEDEVLNLSRLSYVCDYSVNQSMNRE